ncbi:MAG: HlyD family efflux transporter periplasmic adaptor subunit [Hyphomicrobiaceae bacterium]|nr:MAG: HlyD family efflux transporter periplasmic adaptor subunit [Hyphomicrobiaceae bacterium]
MPKSDSTLTMLIVAAVLALGVGYYVPKTFSVKPSEPAKTNGTATTGTVNVAPKAAPKTAWAASAPGRIEPNGGEVRIGAQVPGRIAEVLVAVNDTAAAGDLLVRLDDEELVARLHSALAEVAVRKRERDNTDAGNRLAQDRRSAEDGLATAERQLAVARDELDRALRARRGGTGPAADFAKLRDTTAKAKDKVEQARANLRKALSADGLPAPSRPEAALAAARAELSLAEAALERTRVRAPSAGTILQVFAKAGETATPSPENVLATIGDLSSLRVRAELEERDVGKVRVGQAAVVRSDAFPGKEFEGKIASIAQGLAPSRLGQRGPRKPTDVDVLEVMIDLSGQPPLLPGMRVDVFLRPDAQAQPAVGTKTNTAKAH